MLLKHAVLFLSEISPAPAEGGPLRERRALLLQSRIGGVYVDTFDRLANDAALLPAALRDDRPFATELGQQDALHDGGHKALELYGEAVIADPGAAPAAREAAARVRNHVLGDRTIRRASYPDTAAEATSLEKSIDAYGTDLAQVPAASGPGGEPRTALDVALATAAARREIGSLLSRRSTARSEVGETDVKRASMLRSEIMGAVGRCRAALADEVAANPELPRALDTLVFGYWDDLDTREQPASKAAQDAATAEAPTAEAPTAEAPTVEAPTAEAEA